jgi:predicted Zn finger-like uncharacterized protein
MVGFASRVSDVFTICPKCALTLDVTADDLRVGQGYVRCGRCSSIFNALASLRDEAGEDEDLGPRGFESVVLPSELESSGAAPEAQAGSSEDELQELVARLDRELTATQPAPMTVPRPVYTPPQSAAPATKAAAETSWPLTLPLPANDDDSEHFEIAPAVAAAVAAATEARRRQAEPPPPLVAPLRQSALAVAPEALPFAPSASPRRRGAAPFLELAACVVLVLALLAQIVHHYRGDLVLDAAFTAPLTRLYAALGAPITPNWDLAAYEIRQLGAAAPSAPGGALLIRASVKNGASRPQPVPVIELTLEDRYGNQLASRALEPREYLAPGSARTTLAAGERVDTEIAVADPGQDAVGFELDTCVHTASGALRCTGAEAAR